MTSRLKQIFSFVNQKFWFVRQTPKILNILAYQISYRNFFNIQFLKIMNKVSWCRQIFKITIFNIIFCHLFYDGMNLSAVVITGTCAIVLIDGFKFLLLAGIHGPKWSEIFKISRFWFGLSPGHRIFRYELGRRIPGSGVDRGKRNFETLLFISLKMRKFEIVTEPCGDIWIISVG